mmetsp:Transcript_114451/g.356432  ORF Transcript_114451/g.356432 Transcript_114451/m.356432 type:complete len:210 (+) Transcript_114451:203-832(+)
MAHHKDPLREVALHLRALLQEEGHIQGALRLPLVGEVRRRGPDRQVEEEGLRVPVLARRDRQEEHELRHHRHLPGAPAPPQAGLRRPLRAHGLHLLRLLRGQPHGRAHLVGLPAARGPRRLGQGRLPHGGPAGEEAQGGAQRRGRGARGEGGVPAQGAGGRGPRAGGRRARGPHPGASGPGQGRGRRRRRGRQRHARGCGRGRQRHARR